MPTPHLPDNPKDRMAIYAFLDGISAEARRGLEEGRTRVPLVKSFLLEHVAHGNGHAPKPPQVLLERLGLRVRPIDESFFEVQDRIEADATGAERIAPVGYLEPYDSRFFAYYTTELSVDAQRRVRRWIGSSPDLDSAWFTSQLLQSLWERVASHRASSRYTRLVFSHESIFDLPSNAEDGGHPAEEGDDNRDEETPSREHRNARFVMGDRVGPIKDVLKRLQDAYNPLNALYSLRIPSANRRGGHDVFQGGQVTCRSDSFEDHRNTVRSLYKTYKGVLDVTERRAWSESEAHPQRAGRTAESRGVPLIVRFEGEKLSPQTFDRWISLAFQKRNVFRLWGNPIRLGPTKVHVYGADRHLWQPLQLELTESGLVALLPLGTCGNTFHRLVANIQRYVCPKIQAWLGGTPFSDLTTLPKARARDDAN